MHLKLLGEWDGTGKQLCADVLGYNLKVFLAGQEGISAAMTSGGVGAQRTRTKAQAKKTAHCKCTQV